MSANIDSMIYVGEKPWHNEGRLVAQPKSARELVAAGKFDWTVGALPIFTDRHTHIKSYHAIYREDNDAVLALINKVPTLVQNIDAFETFDYMVGDTIDVETAASLGKGENVFACYKVKSEYKIVDDAVNHYFVVVNDHTKGDGRVTVLNTPIRVVCQNTLSAALSKNTYCLRVPVSTDKASNEAAAYQILSSVDTAITKLNKRAETMLAQKVDQSYLNATMDIIFPYQTADGVLLDTKTNDTMSMKREQFIKCMDVDNLNNYRGTRYQILQALLDFDQHYFVKLETVYDLNKRMKVIPGLSVSTEPTGAQKFLKVMDKIGV